MRHFSLGNVVLGAWVVFVLNPSPGVAGASFIQVDGSGTMVDASDAASGPRIFSTSGPAVGSVSPFTGTTVDSGKSGNGSSPLSWRDVPSQGAGGKAGAARGDGWGYPGGSRYWDPPPEFQNADDGLSRGQDPGVGRSGYDSRMGEDRGFGPERGSGQGSGNGSSGSYGGVERGGATDGYSDPETLDPRREIDPYFLRRQGSGANVPSDEGRRGYDEGGRSGWVGDRGGPGGVGQSWGGGQRPDAFGFSPGYGAGRSGVQGDDGSWGTGWNGGEGAERYEGRMATERSDIGGRSGTGWSRYGDESDRVGRDAGNTSRSGGSFSWNGGTDWVNPGVGNWGMPVPGWPSSGSDWFRPRDGWRGGDSRYPSVYDPYRAPEDELFDWRGYRGPWR
ncbi:MAG: hypothetical protein HQL76_00005 [Magnetococcales bacterium]|nr:hypothetical protein [Magnetococcales bacterium]